MYFGFQKNAFEQKYEAGPVLFSFLLSISIL